MELTLDDCMAIAGRECAAEHELRAAVCVAVGQALHYRYEARGYSDAAEVAKRDADRARAEARAYSEALIAKDSAPDTSDGLDYPARAEVWKLRESVDALRARAERAEAARDRAVQEREAFSLRLSAAKRERDEAREALDISRESAREAREEIAGALALVDEARARVEAIAVERNAIVSELSQTTDAMMHARAERDAALARPTYEARETPPTPAERVAHDAAGARWLRCGSGRASVVCVYRTTDTGSRDGLLWIPLGADGLPCAWPVVP